MTFILAHWGGQLPFGPRVRLGRIPRKHRLRHGGFTLVTDRGIWTRFIDKVGSAKVLFGSDYPLELYPAQAGTWRIRGTPRGGGKSGRTLWPCPSRRPLP